MYRLILFFLCLLPPLLATAQTQPDCDKMLRDGDAFMTRKDPPLEEALRCYLNALNCNSQLAGRIGPKLQGVFDAIKQQKEREQKSKQVAEVRLVAIQKQAKEIQAKTLASQANSYMTEGRYYEAMELADQANELESNGEMQALMMRAYEALQKPGAARLVKTIIAPFKKISQLFYNQAAGILIATDQEAGASVLYNLSGKKVEETLLPGITTNVVFSPDHQRFVVVNHKNSMTLWRADGQKITDLPVLFFNEKCKVEFSPCSQYLLYENGFSGKLWSSDGMILVDGADTLRPLFAEAFFDPSRIQHFGASFCSAGRKTCIKTFGGSERDSVLWDLGLLLQGYQQKSIVIKKLDAAVNQTTDSLLLANNPLPQYFSLAVSPNSPLKYLSMSVAADQNNPLGIIKRDGSIVAYTFDKAAGMLATATEKGEIALWQFNWSMGFEKRYKDKCLARFDPKSEQVLVFESPFKLHLLDLQGGDILQQPVYHLKLWPVIKGENFNAKADKLLTYFGLVCSIHDRDGKLLNATRFPETVMTAVWDQKDQNIMVATDSGFYRIQSDGYKMERLFRPEQAIKMAKISPEGNSAWLWMSDSSSIFLQDAKPVQGLTEKILGGYFSPAGQYFVAEIGDTTMALFTASGKRVLLPRSVREINFSADDQYLLINYHNKLSEIRTKDGVVLHSKLAEIAGVFSSNSKFLLLYDAFGVVLQIMDLQKATIVNIKTSGRLLSCSFSPNSQLIACAFDDDVVQVLDTKGALISSLSELGSVRFSPDGHYLMIQKNYDVWVCTPEGEKISHLVNEKMNPLTPTYGFSPDDCWFISSSFDGVVKTTPTTLGLHQFCKTTALKRAY